ncbi:MAG: ribonuclease P protein component [Propionibacteriaceae bacterium]|jgi:ribonuclease P protein component|nr:ribonuclease P protein component [Propionibacteriaceae bacterium]
MLPQHLRLRRSADFASVIRSGARHRRPSLILYTQPATAPQFGVVVSKMVGNAVTRNRVKRVLRHQAAALLGQGQPLLAVARALPKAADSKDLASDLRLAWPSTQQQ